MAFSKIEPFGEQRADIRSAIIAMTMANTWRSAKQQPLKITDFIPNFEPMQPKTENELKNILKNFQKV
tara:strand:- start:158 stop:361 length:204 start_codon:yes stop_codon:yes gene_type:complete